jgi:NACalpha-BTF3-like transcription factor
MIEITAIRKAIFNLCVYISIEFKEILSNIKELLSIIVGLVVVGGIFVGGIQVALFGLGELGVTNYLNKLSKNWFYQSEIENEINAATNAMISVHTDCMAQKFEDCNTVLRENFDKSYKIIKDIAYTSAQEKAMKDWWIEWSTVITQINEREQSSLHEAIRASQRLKIVFGIDIDNAKKLTADQEINVQNTKSKKYSNDDEINIEKVMKRGNFSREKAIKLLESNKLFDYQRSK